ncbi:protein virilizer [Caerostris extrusa]|uniref:Protein virilizer n=1 Tax=Caerostris extrusa TaxID=172846 RepID=A0AAV4Q5A8_CAEEX|nr:protein virilizer [Caerostris extrusa]
MSASGLKSFANKIQDSNNNAETDSKTFKTCYQKLLEFFVSKQLTRKNLFKVPPVSETKSAPSDSSDTAEIRAASVEPELEAETISNSGETLIQIIISCLQEITCAYHNAGKNFTQPKRYLPARSQFEFPGSLCTIHFLGYLECSSKPNY